VLPGGFVGVDIFFVVSGYVISRSLAKSKAGSFHEFAIDFYRRRTIRILPALLTCLAITSIFAAAFIPKGFWLSSHNDQTGIAAFFALSNFQLVALADGYFSARVPFNPYVHTWSLAVEEQFYLLFPILFYANFKVNRSQLTQSRWAPLLLPSLALISLIWSVYETQSSHLRSFYLLPSRFWELAMGAILYQIQTRGSSYLSSTFASHSISLIGLVLLGTSLSFASEEKFPFPWSITSVIGTALLIAGISNTRKESFSIGQLLSGSILTYIGRISYSLYLWHWPVFVLFRWTFGLSSSFYIAAACVTTFLLAMISFHLVESSFLNSRSLVVLPPWKVIRRGLIATLSTAGFVGFIFYFARPMGLELSVTSDKCTWQPYNLECNTEVKASSLGRSLFVIGDSHAGAYKLMTNIAADRLGAKIYLKNFSGCPLAKLIESSGSNPVCANIERDVVEFLQNEGKPGDIVFLASLRLHRFGDQWSGFQIGQVLARSTSREQGEVNKKALVEAKALIQQLQAMGLHVLIDAPKPIFFSPPFRCSDWFNERNPVCTAGFTVGREFLLKYREPTMAQIEQLRKELGVHIWDPFPILCANEKCSAFDSGKPIFSDGDHLSGHGNRLLADSFERKLSAIWKLTD
jgi:peptidoglycan/LPS O-acetylase OafA/YrhL